MKIPFKTLIDRLKRDPIAKKAYEKRRKELRAARQKRAAAEKEPGD